MDADEILKFIRLTYAALSDGALLALVALGLVLIFKATDVINFAHGEFMLMGAYIGFQALTWFAGMESPTLGVILGILVMVLALVGIGVLVERLILRPMIGEPVISVIMMTIGLSNIIQAIVGMIWGKLPQPLPLAVVPEPGRFEIALEGARRPLLLSQQGLVTVVLVFAFVLLLILFFNRNKQGIAMRATADDQQAAMSMGISIKLVFALTWSLAAVTAGLAGLLLADLTNGVSGDIPVVGLRAFPVIILGGLESISGAVIGAFIISLVETFASGYIDPSLRGVTPYIVLLIVLMVRPYGLFGQKIIERV